MRGGKREGAGRKKHVPPLRTRMVYISDDQAALLRKWGRGNMSDGLRWLINTAAQLIRKEDEVDPTSMDRTDDPHNSD